MNEWDQQIKELKKKYDKKTTPPAQRKRYGVCECGGTGFKQMIVEREFLRECKKCGKRKVM